jgi:nitrogenase subunit NifH
MNKKERAKRPEETKDWCKDMIDKYLAYWSKDNKIYKNLKQFYDENRVTGIIYPSTSQKKKEAWLSSVAKEINKMYCKKISEEIINA